MLINIHCAKCIGIDAVPVEIEVDLATGIGIHLVGLADTAIKESLLRTITALQSMGFRIPGRKIVINLAPADMHKKGSGYDVPIALGIIAASGQRAMPALADYMIMGELGLDGTVREIPGALPIVELAIRSGLKGCILPINSALEAVEFGDIKIFGVESLDDVLRIVEGEKCNDLLAINKRSLHCAYRDDTETTSVAAKDIMDFSEIIGQDGAKRGLEIAAAGGHHAILIGCPGSGKSSLAKAMVNILPSLTLEESVQTTKIYSVAGRGDHGGGLIQKRPYRAPHYSVSMAAMLGGGTENIMPGEISLAHNGILFIDEFCEMPQKVREALRAPMEDKKVTISRLKMRVEYPADFMLIAATNPCPCGYYGEGDRCTCTPAQRLSYISKLSGPIMDRIDIHLYASKISAHRLVHKQKSESSAEVAMRVQKARDIQNKRFADEGIFCNASMNNRQIEKFCPLSTECKILLERIIERMNLSARACSRTIKLARTIADLAGVDVILPEHLSEAISYRFLDKPEF